MLQASSQRLHPEQAEGSRAIQMGLTNVFHQKYMHICLMVTNKKIRKS
jgi:hypothetical protein